MSASQHRLENMIALVDINNQQADGNSNNILGFEPLAGKWEAFGWFVQRVDGNEIAAVFNAFNAARDHEQARPRVFLFDTLMGRSEWHTSELLSLMSISYAFFCWQK